MYLCINYSQVLPSVSIRLLWSKWNPGVSYSLMWKTMSSRRGLTLIRSSRRYGRSVRIRTQIGDHLSDEWLIFLRPRTEQKSSDESFTTTPTSYIWELPTNSQIFPTKRIAQFGRFNLWLTAFAKRSGVRYSLSITRDTAT